MSLRGPGSQARSQDDSLRGCVDESKGTLTERANSKSAVCGSIARESET